MCGISGFCSYDRNYIQNYEYWKQILIDMRESIEHKGNDDIGEELLNNIGLSQTRLSIKNLSKDKQSIIRTINGNTYAIIYNGEIYNTNELKQNLILKGYTFETDTDTEVILYAYIEYGADSVKLLNGIFSYAIWNSFENQLYLFRDRIGVKSLFYTIKNNELVFGSEIKALFKHPNISPEIDKNSLCEILGLGPARTDGVGVFKDVWEIKSGHYGIYSKDNFKVIQYWSLNSNEHKENYEETVENIKYLVTDSVKRQVVSDQPICTFLSGGLDSSVVTAIAYKYLTSQGKTLNTFSFDFTENDVYFKSNSFQPERDRPYVDKVLDIYKTNHTYLECNEIELADYLYDAVDAKDLPGMADIDASMLYFCKLVKNYNKVALTGECADEIFGGYPWFHSNEAFECKTFPWSKNLDIRTALLNNDIISKVNIEEYVNQRYSEAINNVPILSMDTEIEKRRREISYLNIKWFMTTLLYRMDRTSVYSGLKARVPFADYRIIEYLWNIPWEYKCHNGVVKSLLRDAFKDLLPPELLYRKKSPYPKTYNPKYEELLSKRLLDIINNNNSPIQDLIDKQKVLKFIETPSDYGKPWFGQLMAAPQLMAYLIQINYWLSKYNLSLNNI